MAKHLVIVESPAKAKTINRILGKDYLVKSSVGHVRDLPEKVLGVDLEKGFRPKYVVSKGKQKVVSELKQAVKKVDDIYLAPDPDREGEAIAWHLHEVLAPGAGDKPFLRVQYNEITPRAVQKAFANPGEIDANRVDAQQARRILDRIVGYKVSPLLWRRIRKGLSAGRVQSVALRLVCEREDAIEKFIPESFWIMGALVRKVIVPLHSFKIKLARIDDKKAEIKSAEEAKRIKNELDGRKLVVAEIKPRKVTRHAPPPYITSTLQQSASNYCGFSPRRTMTVAQKLYEGIDLGNGPSGLITYMRTDSFAVSRDAQQSCRDFIAGKYGKDYVPEKPNIFRSRKSAQQAHEAIRPTDVKLTPDQLKSRLDAAELKLYTLIWKRFVASQMSPAQLEQRLINIDAVRPENRSSESVYSFHVSASKVLFPGYMTVSGKDIEKSDDSNDGDDEDSTVLPDLQEGEPLECLEWLSEEKETIPPARYSEASLIKDLENNGVGRPSTYAQIISTITARKYVERQKRSLIPTELGRKVNAFLVRELETLFNVNFTARMEEQLDLVEEGKTEWVGMLEDFYRNFSKWVGDIKEPLAEPEAVRRVLEAAGQISNWAEPVKRGRRTYDDRVFVESIREQFEKAEKGVTQRQFDSLLSLVCRYRKQVDGLEELLQAIGKEEMLAKSEFKPPRDVTVNKLELIGKLDLDERTRHFVDSLAERVSSRRRLTEAQIKALDGMLFSNKDQLPDFDALRESLQIEEPERTDNNAAKVMLEGLSAVKEWKPPVKRGKRTFDDKQFYESLKSQEVSRGYLTPRQGMALQRMFNRYAKQIPGYEKTVKELGLKPAASRHSGKKG